MIQALNISRYNATSPLSPISPEPLPYETASRSSDNGDTLQISTAAKGSLLSKILRPSQAITVSSLETEFRRDSILLENRLNVICQKLGIPSDTPMKLYPGFDGRTLVAGNDKWTQAFGEAINADPETVDLVNKTAANAEFLEACKKHEEFSAAYAKNPTTAVQRFAFLLEGSHPYQMFLTFQNNRINTDMTDT